MRRLILSLISFLTISLNAGVLISPQDAILQNYGPDVTVKKKSRLLNKTQAQQVSTLAKAKLTTKLFRTFSIDKSGKNVGHAVLLNGKVRTKNAAVLYLIDTIGTIRAIEIVAFNEPPEYIPTSGWIEQFKDKSIKEELRVDRDIPTITGATMSARNIADGARIALALYETVLRR